MAMPIWNKRNLTPPPSYCPAYSKGEYKSGDIGKLCSDLLSTVQDVKDLRPVMSSERYLLSRMVYKANTTHRRERGFHALRKVLRCVQRFEEMNLCNTLDIFSESMPSMHDISSSVHLPSRQMLEYLMVRLLGSGKLLSQTVHYCLESHLYTMQQLNHGLFKQNNSVFAGLVSRLWVVCWTQLKSVCRLFSNLVPWREKLKPSKVAWLPDDTVLPHDLSAELNTACDPSKIMSASSEGVTTASVKSGCRLSLLPATSLSDSSTAPLATSGDEDSDQNNSIDLDTTNSMEEDIGEAMQRKSIIENNEGDCGFMPLKKIFQIDTKSSSDITSSKKLKKKKKLKILNSLKDSVNESTNSESNVGDKVSIKKPKKMKLETRNLVIGDSSFNNSLTKEEDESKRLLNKFSKMKKKKTKMKINLCHDNSNKQVISVKRDEKKDNMCSEFHHVLTSSKSKKKMKRKLNLSKNDNMEISETNCEPLAKKKKLLLPEQIVGKTLQGLDHLKNSPPQLTSMDKLAKKKKKKKTTGKSGQRNKIEKLKTKKKKQKKS